MEIAFEYNLHVVEDAAEAHGASLNGKKAGAWGDAGCFSLFSNKIIAAGEGGLITTNDEKLYKQLKHLNRMAFDKDHTFLHKKLSYNFVMPNLSAAVALAQLERIDSFIAKRKEIAGWYDEKLGQYTIPRPEGSVVWYYDLVLPDHIDNSWIYEELKERGVEIRLFFKPMSMQPHYGGQNYENTKAFEFSRRGIYLPTHVGLSREDVEHISDIVINILEGV